MRMEGYHSRSLSESKGCYRGAVTTTSGVVSQSMRVSVLFRRTLYCPPTDQHVSYGHKVEETSKPFHFVTYSVFGAVRDDLCDPTLHYVMLHTLGRYCGIWHHVCVPIVLFFIVPIMTNEVSYRRIDAHSSRLS